MFSQVLVAIDGSATGNRGLKAAIGLASNQKAALSILHVVDDLTTVSYVGDMGYVPAGYVDELLDDLRANGRRILTKAEAVARDSGVDAKTLLIESRGGFDYTGADCIGWMREAGFINCRVIALTGPHSAVIGVK